MTRVAIIAAMAGELRPLVKGWQHERRNGVDLWRTTRNGSEWVAALAGAGQQAATRAFGEIERDGPVDIAFSIGWVGALGESYLCGKAYTVSGVIDMRTGERFDVSPMSQNLDIDYPVDVVRKTVSGDPMSQKRDMDHPGLWLVTSPRVADAAEKRRLATAYGAGLVDMEAAAVARLAAMRGIPFYCIKGVSDGFGDDLPDFNRFISPEGQFEMGRLLLFVLWRPWHWPALVRMGENSNMASHAIKDLLLEKLAESGDIRNRNGDTNHESRNPN